MAFIHFSIFQGTVDQDMHPGFIVTTTALHETINTMQSKTINTMQSKVNILIVTTTPLHEIINTMQSKLRLSSV